MRVLFQPFAASTHIATQVPLAWALRSAGHEVCVATHPDVVDDITRAGLTAVPVGNVLELDAKMNPDGTGQPEEFRDGFWLEALDISEMRDERLTYDYMHGVFTAWTALVHQSTMSDRYLDDMVEFARDWQPDLVIWDTMTFAGPVAARVTGATHARLLFGLDLVGRMREKYLRDMRARPAKLRDDPLAEWLGRTMERYGREFTEDLIVGQWTIDPTPSWMRFPVDHDYVPVRYVPYHGKATIPGWLREPPERRRVCLTLGVSFREVVGGDQASVGDLLDAVAGLDLEVIATLNADQLAELHSLPDNVRAVDFVPLEALLPTCSAIIHHSGSGTFQTALVHGVPQVIVPSRMWCNVPRAQQLQEYGAGLYIDADRFSPADLRAMLVRVLEEPSFAENAARARAEMLGTPSPAEIVPLLEKLTAEHRD